MIDVWKKIYYGNTGSGDFAEVTIDSMMNMAVLLGNESTYGDKRFVVYHSDIDNLIDALQQLKEILE